MMTKRIQIRGTVSALEPIAVERKGECVVDFIGTLTKDDGSEAKLVVWAGMAVRPGIKPLLKGGKAVRLYVEPRRIGGEDALVLFGAALSKGKVAARRAATAGRLATAA